MHTRAAGAAFDAEPSNKIVTSKATSDRSMSRPFPTDAYWYAAFCVGQLSKRLSHAAAPPSSVMNSRRRMTLLSWSQGRAPKAEQRYHRLHGVAGSRLFMYSAPPRQYRQATSLRVRQPRRHFVGSIRLSHCG